MKKIFKRWYVSIFLIPIVLTYFTDFIGLPLIFRNWNYSVITCQFILIVILLYELISLDKDFERFKFSPKESDKKIVKRLLETLDIDMFQEEIYKQDAWYGYKSNAIGKIIDFTADLSLIRNKTTDDELNNLLENFSMKLEVFKSYSSLRLYGLRNSLFYVPNKDTDEIRVRTKIETGKMNEMTKEAFEALEMLIEYLKRRKYFDYDG